MKKHIYILSFGFGISEWMTLAYSPKEIDNDYLEDICKEVLKNTELNWVRSHIENIEEFKGYEHREEVIKDIGIKMEKSFTFDYLGYMNMHELNYNIIKLNHEGQGQEQRLEG
jgi:hypothetical protein